MNSSTLQQGTQLQGGKYRIVKVLGQGGFGITYLGEQAILNRKVAIKEFFMKSLCERDNETSMVSVPSLGSKEMVSRFREKFIKEARNIFKMEHPNIIRIHDIFDENGTSYYVMDYCEHGSLADLLLQHPKGLPEDQALAHINQIASALNSIHNYNINHLDVKPANIMLNDNNEAILIDFGLSKQYDVETGNQTSTTPVGISHGYAPIEQYNEGGVKTFSPATDIYSLGATLYKLLSGKTPPDALDLFGGNLPDIGCNRAIFNAIECAMKPKRSLRPQTVDEWISLLGGEEKDVKSQHEGGAAISESVDIDSDSSTETTILYSCSKEQSTNSSFEQAMNLLRQDSVDDSQYETIVSLLTKSASEGYTPAYNELGLMYHYGYGTRKDPEIALYWFNKGVEACQTKAMVNLAYCYENGYGTEVDRFKAVKYFRMASDQGDPEAQVILGDHYKDVSLPKEAIKWYTKSAQKNNIEALFRLVDCYDDNENKNKWLKKIRSIGSEECFTRLVDYYRSKGILEEAADCLIENALRYNDSNSMYELGVYYYEKKKDIKKSREWLNKVPIYGSPELCLAVVDFYEKCQEDEDAYDLLRKMADKGDPTAHLRLGKKLFQQSGQTKNASAAHFLFAANNNLAEAMYYYALCLQYGYGETKDLQKALLWYKKALSNGYSDAESRIKNLEFQFMPWYKKIFVD